MTFARDASRETKTIIREMRVKSSRTGGEWRRFQRIRGLPK